MQARAQQDGTQPICEFLKWDSQFFDLRIARIVENRLTAERMAGALEWATSESIDCLYLLVDSDDPQTIALAEGNQFNFQDVRITLERRLPRSPDAEARTFEPLRSACPADIPAIRSLAAISHRTGRFHNDRRFPGSRCEELYQTWIEKSCTGLADRVFVVGHSGNPVGYLSCRVSPEGMGTFGLMAVDPKARRQGIGERLVQNALRYFEEYGADRTIATIHGANYASQRLFQSFGFRTQSVQLWYHRWF